MADTLAHPWPTSTREAIALQESLRDGVIERDEVGEVRHVAGVDVGFEDGGQTTRAAVVLQMCIRDRPCLTECPLFLHTF